jgi:hypothetical protein
MPNVFIEKWRRDHIPCLANKLEHFPELLKIFVKTFLSNEWILVACGISTTISIINSIKFFELEVTVFENSATKTIFLYNELFQFVIQS